MAIADSFVSVSSDHCHSVGASLCLGDYRPASKGSVSWRVKPHLSEVRKARQLSWLFGDGPCVIELGRLGSNSQATCGNLTGTSWLHSRRPTHGFSRFQFQSCGENSLFALFWFCFACLIVFLALRFLSESNQPFFARLSSIPGMVSAVAVGFPRLVLAKRGCGC